MESSSWVINPTFNAPMAVMTQEQKTIFSRAFSRLTGSRYQPLIYMGYQLVYGYNHKYIALQHLDTPELAPQLVEIIIYQPLEGEPAIREVRMLN